MSPSRAPAILGGPPVRPDGLPPWPIRDRETEHLFEKLLSDGSWGKYDAEHTQQLTARLREIHQVEHVILTCSGTCAVEFALRGLQVTTGTEVIMSAYDYKPNFTNVVHVGAKAVLVDVDPDDGQIDAERIAAEISERTQAILVSHLHGGCVAIGQVSELAQTHGIPVIEDACQMSCATVENRIAGTNGDVGVISFGGTKLLTSGRGGAVLTNRDDVAQRIRLHARRGNDVYPLSELQAAVLLPQLELLDARRRIRRNTVQALRARLEAHRGLRPFPAPVTNCQPDYYRFGLWYDATEFGGLTRQRFVAAMRAEGIPVDVGFRALHRMHARSRFRHGAPLPHAEHADETVVGLHHSLLLGGDRAVQEFVDALDKIVRHATILQTETSAEESAP